MTDLTPLIELVQRETHPYVVVGFTEEGILWRAETLASCAVMAKVIGNCKVMPREEFIETLRLAQAIHHAEED